LRVHCTAQWLFTGVQHSELYIQYLSSDSTTQHRTQHSPGTKREGLGPFALAIAMRMSSSSRPSKGSRDRMVRPNIWWEKRRGRGGKRREEGEKGKRGEYRRVEGENALRTWQKD
jgi:hypothetical protein